MMHNDSSHGYSQGRGWFARLKDFAGTLTGMLVMTIAVIGLLYLAFPRLGQLVQFLPLAVLLLCPLMHVFMHRGHGGHGDQAGHRH